MFFAVTSFLSCGTKLQDASGVTNFDVSKLTQNTIKFPLQNL